MYLYNFYYKCAFVGMLKEITAELWFLPGHEQQASEIKALLVLANCPSLTFSLYGFFIYYST